MLLNISSQSVVGHESKTLSLNMADLSNTAAQFLSGRAIDLIARLRLRHQTNRFLAIRAFGFDQP